MQARVDDIKYMRDDEGFWLRIRLPHDDVSQTMNWIAGRNPNKAYDLELKEHREKRSLDANAYCWVLIGKLAARLGQNKSDVYREYIKEIGDNYTVSCFQKEAVPEMKRLWEDGYLGRIAEEFQSKVAGCTNLRLYYGSSDFDTKQMSRLIDAIIADCKENGIEVLSEKEKALLLEEWK